MLGESFGTVWRPNNKNYRVIMGICRAEAGITAILAVPPDPAHYRGFYGKLKETTLSTQTMTRKRVAEAKELDKKIERLVMTIEEEAEKKLKENEMSVAMEDLDRMLQQEAEWV